MNPLRIRARNYGPYDELDVILPDGCTAILGEIVNAPAGIESNGAGKSHLLQAIPLALFGPGEGMRSMAPYLTRDSGATELMVELEFDHAGDAYRVRRGYSARGAGKTTLDLERFLDSDPTDNWEPLTRASAKETQAELERLLGLSRDTFLASSLALQGGGSFADPSVNPAARKRLLADALGLDRWDRFHEQAKADLKERDAALARFAPLIETARQTVGEKPALVSHAAELRRAVAALEETHGKAQADLEAATEKYHEARALTEKVTAARAQVETAEAEKRRLDAVADAAAAARDAVGPMEARLRELHPVVEELPAHEEQERRLRDEVAEHRRLVSEYQARIGAAATLRTRQEDLWARVRKLTAAAAELDEQRRLVFLREQDTCDRCGQKLGEEASVRMAASLQGEVEKARAEAAALTDEAKAIEVPEVGDQPAGEPPIDALTAVAARVHKGRQAQVELSSLTERIRGERQKIAQAEDREYLAAIAHGRVALNAAVAALAEAQEACPGEGQLLTIQGDGLAARAQVTETQERLQADRANLTRAEVELERVAEAETNLVYYTDAAASVQDEIDVLTMLVRAYSRDGIPALILENAAVPFIEAEASRILAELGTGFRVELRTQAALKSGDGVRDTLDVIVVTEDGLEQPYALCSGGEETRIGLALRIALAGLLAHRRGAESRLLAIDEPSFLDAAGMQRLVEILRGLEGTFSKLILVSHVSELRDAFDQAIVVQKDGTRARVLSADRDPVPA